MMSVDIRSSDRRRYMNGLQEREKEIAAGLLKVSQPASPKALQENEKRMRREIANSNERRRMQCINAGFSNLRALIPNLEGEKLSKAAILQHTTEYITSLANDKSRLEIQLDHSKRLLAELGQDRLVTDSYVSSSPPPSKRKKRDTESSDEGVGSLSDASDEGGSELQNENVSLRHQLEAQRQQCAHLEERNRILESQILTLLQAQSAHSNTLSEMHPVNLEVRQQDSLYNRELAEVISTRETFVQSPRVESFQPPRPLSPTPERGMSLDAPSRMDTSSPGYMMVPSSHKEDPNVPGVKVEAAYPLITRAEDSAPLTASPATALATQTSDSHHHHNYCHRDHPRRRHRQQAQLEQQRAEEELRRQQEQQDVVMAPVPFRQKHNTQNLENLVEAIRQIEGDRVLCDEGNRLYDVRQSLVHSEESERETSSISDQDEFRSEGSGRDSPPHNHHVQQQTTHQVITHQQTSLATTAPSISSPSSSFSEKYPIATHLLHRPLHPSYFRPGVIVHKQ